MSIVIPFSKFPQQCQECKNLLIDHITEKDVLYRCYANSKLPTDEYIICNSFRFVKER